MSDTTVLKDWTPKELLTLLFTHSRKEIHAAMPDGQVDVQLETYNDGHGGIGMRLLGYPAEPKPAEDEGENPEDAEAKGSLAVDLLTTLLNMAGHKDPADRLVDDAEKGD